MRRCCSPCSVGALREMWFMPANGCVVRLCLSLSARRGRCDIMGRPLVGYTANKAVVCAPSATCASKWRRQQRAERTYSSQAALRLPSSPLLGWAGGRGRRSASREETFLISQLWKFRKRSKTRRKRQKGGRKLFLLFMDFSWPVFFSFFLAAASRRVSFSLPRCQLAPPPLSLLCCAVVSVSSLGCWKFSCACAQRIFFCCK